MKITQLRNATLVIETGDKAILVDPMLAPKGAIPPLKYLTGTRRRNPLVDLPTETPAVLERVTHCLITHCQKGHFDHLDRAGVKWLRDNAIPVFCMDEDAAFLSGKGLKVTALLPGRDEQDFLGGTITPIPCVHGRGMVGRMMAHGHGYVMRLPGAPVVYVAGDTILTDTVETCLKTWQPDIVIVPAGGARFDAGGDIIMGQAEVLAVCGLSKGVVIANHLEALDHCPVTREGLAMAAREAGLAHKLVIPVDGESRLFPATSAVSDGVGV